jgi:adenosylmethionine---8-amino-7-oxononanoate aminotransferase
MKQTSRSRTKQLARWDHTYLWHPFTQMKEWEQEDPVIIERGKGSYLIDTKGRRYLDGTSSIWVNLHGHRHPALDKALRTQLEKVAHSTLLGLSNPPAIELARELVRIAPKGLTRVFYSDDGSTAVEVALKMAVQYWQQRKPRIGPKHLFVNLTGAYHGDTVGAMSVGNIDLFHQRFRPLLFSALKVEVPRARTSPSSLLANLQSIERLFKRRHKEIAGLIVEPLVQAAAGIIVAPSGYLRGIRHLCSRYNVLLIADEVATGFGRTGKMFACQHEGVTPDLMALSKGLTGGYMPLAATLATEEIYQAFLGEYRDWKTFFHGHSYTGNPLGCAVALASLDVFRREHTLKHLQPKIKTLTRLLKPLADHPHIGDIRQCGFMAGIELVKDRSTREPYPLEGRIGHRVAMEARRRGLLLRPIGNVIVLMPPLVTSLKDLNQIIQTVHHSIIAAIEWLSSERLS